MKLWQRPKNRNKFEKRIDNASILFCLGIIAMGIFSAVTSGGVLLLVTGVSFLGIFIAVDIMNAKKEAISHG